MKSKTTGVFRLSKETPIPEDILTAEIKKINEKIFKVPSFPSEEEGILSWVIEGKNLILQIASSRIRVHNTLLRVRKELSQGLATNLKVGIRGISAKDCEIVFEVSQHPQKPISLPFAKSITFSEKECKLTLKEVDEEFLRNNAIDRMVKRIHEKIEAQEYGGKEEYWKLMWESSQIEHTYFKDPTQDMLEKQWLEQGPTKGKWFFRPQAARILQTMRRIAVKEVLEPLGFHEVVEPHHESFDILLKTGHLSGMPGEFYYVSEPKTRDPAAWEEFVDIVKITQKVPSEELQELLDTPKAISCYVQCPVIYWSFSGKTISLESLPIKIYDSSAVSNRYESGGRHGIERVDEFHRLEPVYIGTPEQLLTLRDDLIDRYKYVFNEILELEWRMAWVTPFYMQQAGQSGVEDSEEMIKGTIDFEAFLPYRGDRDSEWLEFQNLSILGDKYTKAFTIKTQKGELWSGCSGIGLERWTAAFLAQKGLDPDEWPIKFQERFGEMPPETIFL